MKIVLVIITAGRQLDPEPDLDISAGGLYRIDQPAIDGEADIAYSE